MIAVLIIFIVNRLESKGSQDLSQDHTSLSQ